MYRRYYDGYRPAESKDRGEIIVPRSVPLQKNEITPEITEAHTGDIAVTGSDCKNSILSLPFDIDDLILIGILLFLLMDRGNDNKDDDNDIFMLIIVGLIIFSDIF